MAKTGKKAKAKTTKKKSTKRKPVGMSTREASSARNACIGRRTKKGRTLKKDVRRCNSLFYADCLTQKGTISKTKRCQKIARAPLSKGKYRGKGRHW